MAVQINASAGHRVERRAEGLTLDGVRLAPGARLEIRTADGWLSGRFEIARDGSPRLALTSFEGGGGIWLNIGADDLVRWAANAEQPYPPEEVRLCPQVVRSTGKPCGRPIADPEALLCRFHVSAQQRKGRPAPRRKIATAVATRSEPDAKPVPVTKVAPLPPETKPSPPPVTTPPRFVIVGLGSVGRHYQESRHNIGFLAIDALADGIIVERDGVSLVKRAERVSMPILLVKPQTYMERCGSVIAELLAKHRLPAARLVVVFDDEQLPFGFLRIRSRGAHGGHPGMKAIMHALHSSDSARVRIGTGSAPGDRLHMPPLDFSAAERPRLPGIFSAVSAALDLLLQGQVEKAMSLFNRRDIPVDGVRSSAG